MTDEQGLLAAIWAEPYDDTPRLVYADWLQENGQPERAEFVRVQCEAAALRWDDPRWKDLAGRAKELLEGHGEEWIEPFAWLSPGGKTEVRPDEPTVEGWGGGVQLNWVDPTPSDMGDVSRPFERCFDFHRGFVRRVFLDAQDLGEAPVPHGIAGPNAQVMVRWAFDIAPAGWVEELWPRVRRALLALPFSDCHFSNFNHEMRWLPLLAGDPDVARRTSGLSVEGGGEGEAAVVAPLLSRMPRLDYLELSYGVWSPAVIRDLGQVGLNTRLQHLRFHSNHTDGGPIRIAETLAALADAGPWPELRSLMLDGLEGAAPAAVARIEDGMLPSLKRLSLWGPGGSIPFFTALVNSPALEHVERIEAWQSTASKGLAKLAARSGGRFVYR